VTPGAAETATADRRFLIGACGSVGILNLHEYLLALRSRTSGEVRVLLTESAARFVRPSVLQLFCDQVICSGSEPGIGSSHVELAEWATEFAVLPASANTLGQVANGLSPNLLTCTILAFSKPVRFFPNMNLDMWQKPAVQRNIAALRADGHIVEEPVQQHAYKAGARNFSQSAVLPAPAMVAKLLADGTGLRPACVPDPERTPP